MKRPGRNPFNRIHCFHSEVLLPLKLHSEYGNGGQRECWVVCEAVCLAQETQGASYGALWRRLGTYDSRTTGVVLEFEQWQTALSVKVSSSYLRKEMGQELR